MQTVMLNKQQQQQGSPNWWWFDTQNNNNKNNSDATRRSSWLQSALSELDEKTISMLKLIEADADSFAQRAEMYYRKRPELISVVEEFYRMHRSLAERFDQMKPDSSKRLLMMLGSPFSCNEQQVPPLKKSFSMSLSPGMYKYCETCSDSDDQEDNPESEVEDPEEDIGTEPTPPKGKCGGKPVAIDMESLTLGGGNYEIQTLEKEVKRLREENRNLRDEMTLHEEQKVEMKRELTMSTDEIKRLKEVARFDENNKIRGMSPKDEGKKREDENNLIQKKQAPVNLGKPIDPIEPNSNPGGRFLRRLFPKSSKKSKVTTALSFGTFH